MSRSLLAKMSSSSCIINTSRGGLVDQEALLEALQVIFVKKGKNFKTSSQSGKIGGAGLDVMTPEPLSKNHPLASCSNVVLTPHISRWQRFEDRSQNNAENIQTFHSLHFSKLDWKPNKTQKQALPFKLVSLPQRNNCRQNRDGVFSRSKSSGRSRWTPTP